MDSTKRIRAIVLALLAAVFYAVNVPFSKVLLESIGPTFLAALLYLGAGIGVAALYALGGKKRESAKKLSRSDLPYVVGMVVLDIAAPIFLMLGINLGTSSNAALLGNFEIVATTIFALALFREAVTTRLWVAIGLITLSSIILSFGGQESFAFSTGSLFVLAATACWGLENNCTRMISSKNTYHIVIIKGIFSGLGALGIAFVVGERVPDVGPALLALFLGFVAYGLSIFFYVRAQNTLGAAKTSAYYAAAPFIGALLSFVVLHESLSATYVLALAIMLAGAALVVADTLVRDHAHVHSHSFTHVHDVITHTHTVEHSHEHRHYANEGSHTHHHSTKELLVLSNHTVAGMLDEG